MSTAPVRKEQHFVLDFASWELYESILNHLDDRHVFITYDQGRLEMMSPSWRHDKRSRRIARLIDIVAEETGTPVDGGGSATIRRKSLKRGLEADQWFYVSHAAAIQGREEIDPERDPPPDLAVEVEISRRLLDREGIYAAMGVPELWRDDGKHLRMLVLGSDQRYARVLISASFPMLTSAIVEQLLASGSKLDDTTWAQRVRKRIRALLAT